MLEELRERVRYVYDEIEAAQMEATTRRDFAMGDLVLVRKVMLDEVNIRKLESR